MDDNFGNVTLENLNIAFSETELKRIPDILNIIHAQRFTKPVLFKLNSNYSKTDNEQKKNKKGKLSKLNLSESLLTC